MKTIHILLAIISLSTFAQKADHTLWNTVLEKHVSANGNVNYKAIKADDTSLKNYLNELVKNQPKDDWTKNEQLAYWINAYNAYTLKLIIDRYPLKSIQDISQPWDIKFIPHDMELISLNDLEHNILRKMNEPRIHFAIVCASFSCPKLSNKAFIAKTLEQQLTESTKEFLSDKARNIISENDPQISKVFKWFSKDFDESGGVINFINQYSNTKIAADAKVKYLDYNWALNE